MKQFICNNKSLIITDIESLNFFHPRKFEKVEHFLWGVHNATYVFSNLKLIGITFSNN